MKFWEAMKALEEGKKVRQKIDPRDFYVQTTLTGKMTLTDGKNKYNKEDSPLGRIFPTDDWEIYEEPEKTYTFMEVVKRLREGKQFRRPIWIDKCYVLADAVKNIHFTDQEGRCFAWNISDIEANDWVQVK